MRPILALPFACLLAPALADDLCAQRGRTPTRRLNLADLGPVPFRVKAERPARLHGARPRILLTGYWPPTNEMVRRFSTDKTQNPSGWIGSDWESRGYDIHSFFPEFPSGPSKGVGDFEVDYQDTSADWWRITNQIQPLAIITFSRGGIDRNWEIEMNGANHQSWYPDYLAPLYPNPSPPDGNIPAGTHRRSTLPAHEMLDAIAKAKVDVNAWICFASTGGNFLSEFIGYHGLFYKNYHSDPRDPAWCVAAGHIHVGPHTVAVLEQAVFVSLREMIAYVDAVVAGQCQQDLGYGGVGTPVLKMCGTGLGTGERSDLLLRGVAANNPAFIVLSPRVDPVAVYGRLFAATVNTLVIPSTTDARGELRLPGITGGGGPWTFYLQCALPDPRSSGGVAISNALAIHFEP